MTIGSLLEVSHDERQKGETSASREDNRKRDRKEKKQQHGCFDNLTIKEMEQKKKLVKSTLLIAFTLQIFQRVSN